MAFTVAEAIERSLSEIYEAGGVARPDFDFLQGAITDTATTMTLEGKASFVPEFSLLEFYDDTMEIAEAGDTDGTTVPLLTRGYLETTAGAHADGVRVVLDPPYPRQLLLNGLKAVIGQLYGFGLYQVAYTDSLDVNTQSPVTLPTGAKDVISILYQNGTNWFPIEKNQYRLFHNYSGLNTLAVQFFSGRHGADTRIVYAKDFDTSTFTLSTDLEATVGLPSTFTPHLGKGLAGWVLEGRDVPVLEGEHIRPSPRAPEQPGTHINVGRALWTSFLSGPVKSELVRLQRANPPQLVYERIGG